MRESAVEELRAIPFPFRRQINQKIVKLKDTPRPVGSERMGDDDHFRLRADGWRVLYEVDDTHNLVTIVAIKR